MSSVRVVRTEDMVQALWEAYYHNELDEIASAIEDNEIDGNDHPALKLTAEKLLNRLPPIYVKYD